MSTETWFEYIKRKLAHTVLVFADFVNPVWPTLIFSFGPPFARALSISYHVPPS